MCAYTQPPQSGSDAGRRSADGSSTSMVDANASRFSTRSILTVTRSPGIAPDTSRIWPSCLAIIRPPAAGFSIPTDTPVPMVSISFVGQERQAERIAEQPLERAVARVVQLGSRHARGKRREFRLRLTGQRGSQFRAGLVARRRNELIVQASQPVDQRGARIAAGSPGVRGQVIELTDDFLDPLTK